MKYYIIAGEPSGDLHGANLMAGLRRHDPQAQFRFWGGDKMVAQGGAENIVKHYKETSFFGIVQVVANLPTILGQLSLAERDIEAYAPDAVILIDYPSFNMKIARFAHRRGIKVLYYIAPKVWAWKEFRVRSLRRYVDKLYTIFPFETAYFARHGIGVTFEGNPLVDAIEARRGTMPSRDEFARENGLDSRPVVALLAGSRRGEIRDNLPMMVALSRRFPSHQFVVTGVSWLDRSLYDKYLAGSDVRYVCDKTYETLAIAEAAIVTSGTATLETALMGVPEVVVYRTAWWQVKLRPYVLKIPYISLVNINLDRESVREIVQSGYDTTQAEKELRSIIVGGHKRARMLRDFDELHALIGGAGASDRFAARMVEELSKGQ